MNPVTDTRPDVAAVVRAQLMALSGVERFRMGEQMFDAARRRVMTLLADAPSETGRQYRTFEGL